jgi:hypothetical protein
MRPRDERISQAVAVECFRSVYDFVMTSCSCYKLFDSFTHITGDSAKQHMHLFSVFKIESWFGIKKMRDYEIDFASMSHPSPAEYVTHDS